MPRRFITMRLPEDLLAKVDAKAGPGGRTGFVVRALEAALAGDLKPGRQKGDRSAVAERTTATVAPSLAPPRASETAVQRNIRLADERRARERAA